MFAGSDDLRSEGDSAQKGDGQKESNPFSNSEATIIHNN